MLSLTSFPEARCRAISRSVSLSNREKVFAPYIRMYICNSTPSRAFGARPVSR
jgi:hypothetical protein